ncbi:MAG: SPOR domain-containing protein [Rhodobacter sp.]|nr:SPOR domain-containing protein [Rhodobacter sp.]MCA3492117.1 SPOR domain-containing protein [Rhodobacter sp.]MCA3500371.1 SPOR domain-containing protein [Rhodobacter sp.]MCA3503280.1 SPOR domain-containing protein [Rhodobacter sp.]MCA3517600.1 SPOR domain-containing protein [Rhodobacter sp.]
MTTGYNETVARMRDLSLRWDVDASPFPSLGYSFNNERAALTLSWQDRRDHTWDSSDAGTADITMMEKILSPTPDPSRPDRRTSLRKSGYGVQAGRKSFFGRTAFRLVLVAGGLALALPYVLAFTPPVQSYPGAPASAGMAPEIKFLLDAEAAAADPPEDRATLNVVQSSFDPVLVERVDENTSAMPLGIVGGSADAPVVTTEMLRILAQMTPEQIDALTFLLLSQQDPKAAAAADGDQTDALDVEAPWVGDWTAGDLEPENADLVSQEEPVQNELLAGWYVFEASADEAVIRNIDDPLSAVRVSPGTVLGNLGFVSEIRLDGEAAKVVLSGGDVILSDPATTITAETPGPSEPRSDLPLGIAMAMAASDKVAMAETGTVAGAASVTGEPPADDAAALDGAGPEAPVDGLASSPPAQDTQTPSTKSASYEPLDSTDDADGRYVQVATFKSVENAQVAKDMLMSGGINGQLRKTFLNGASYHLVLAGPFDPADMDAALTRVTRLGFRDAFIIR